MTGTNRLVLSTADNEEVRALYAGVTAGQEVSIPASKGVVEEAVEGQVTIRITEMEVEESDAETEPEGDDPPNADAGLPLLGQAGDLD